MKKLLSVFLGILFSISLYGPTPDRSRIEQSEILRKVANISEQVDTQHIGLSNIPLYPFIESPNPDSINISSKYGYRIHPIFNVLLLHTGIDVITNKNQPIMASGNGIVVRVEYSKYGYGNHIIIKHNEKYETLYAHLSEIKIKEGDYVNTGDVIGLAGQTGLVWGKSYHTHFELRKNGIPIDPMKFIGAKTIKEYAQKTYALKQANDYLIDLFGVNDVES